MKCHKCGGQIERITEDDRYRWECERCGAPHKWQKPMNEPLLVKCPKCGRVFDSRDTFWWGKDKHGDATIENIYCAACGASTHSWDGRMKAWNYDDFKAVTE